MKLNGAQILVEQLCRNGAETVFGYPGGAVLPVYDELYRNRDRIHHVIAAHEQGAAHAADGYARASGKTGVVLATSGPGATNLVTGIANAYLDSVPMVAVTGNVAVPLLGKDSFQEVDIVGITMPVVKHSFAVKDVSELERDLNDAFRIAAEGRPGPVLVDIPKSVQTAVCEYRGEPPETPSPAPEDFRVEEAVEALCRSRRPFLYAGGGVVASGAEQELYALAKWLSAPVGFSMMGLTAMDHDCEFNLGMCGMHGNCAASMAQSESDLVLALGVRFSDRATGNVDAYRRGRTIIHVDIDPAEMDKNVETQIEICGDIRAVLAKMLRLLPPSHNSAWLAHTLKRKKQGRQAESRGGKLTPRNVILAASKICGPETVVATDVGQHQMWTMQYFPFRTPRTLLTSGGLGTMGFGLGAAIGGCIARGRKRTLLFTGDGSFGMNLNELATAVSENLPLVIVIFNNGVLGMVRQWQTMFYGKRYSSTTLERRTDFPALARAFGAAGVRVETLPELEQALADLPAEGPVVLDCRIDPDEFALPMIPPGGTISDIITERKECHGK